MSSRQQRLCEAFCGCSISQAELRSREIDRKIAEDRDRYLKQINVLLSGTPGSGKSTFLTQASILFGKDFDNDELNKFKPVIYGDIIKTIKVLVNARTWLMPHRPGSNQQHADKILNFQTPQYIDTDKFMSYFDSLKSLWLDKAIQDVYDRRSELQLGKSSEYFLSHLDRIGQPGYLPTKVDALYAKATGGYGPIVEHEFNINDRTFNIVPHDNMRNLRLCLNHTFKKFLFSTFENIASILFLVSSISYDQVSKDGTNCLVYSCKLFETTVNFPWFAHSSCIILFTKTDLLEEKIKYSNIKDYFPAFQGDPRKLEDVQNFILQMFDSKRRERSNALFHHFTTADNTENIRFVFAAAKDSIM